MDKSEVTAAKKTVRAGDIKQGELFICDGDLYRRVFINGYIGTQNQRIIGANDFSVQFIHEDNIMERYIPSNERE